MKIRTKADLERLCLNQQEEIATLKLKLAKAESDAAKHLEYLKEEVKRSDASRKTLFDDIEQLRKALTSVSTAALKTHELVVDAKFDATKVQDALQQSRQLIREALTEQVLKLAFPQVSSNPMLILGGLGVVAALFGGLVFAKPK